MNIIFRRQWDEFQEHIENSSIEEYFGILTSSEYTLNMKLHKTEFENVLRFQISFQKPSRVYLDELNNDINLRVASYLLTKVFVEFDITYLEIYPFRPPTWSVKQVVHTLPLDVQEHYTHLVESHNDQNLLDWSPATRIEKDILEFLQKFLGHFEYLLQTLCDP